MIKTLWMLLLIGCSGGNSPEPTVQAHPNMVLITLDTTRADRLGAYGDPLARTPNLDALAKQSAVFQAAYTTVPLTIPAHASIMTGLYPKGHGLRDNATGRLNPELPTLADSLKQKGYNTGAFVGSYVLDSGRGLDRGFDTYHDQFSPQELARAQQISDVERPAREVIQQSLRWWDSTTGPKFLWIHLFDAHRPYEAPEGWTGDPYRGEIFSMDRALHPLLASIGDDSAVIVVADHGENLWDNHELEHGVVLTRATLRVPLIVRPPGGLQGEESSKGLTPPPRPTKWTPVPGLGPDNFDLTPVPDSLTAAKIVTEPVSIIDIAPTFLAWAETECVSCDGRSLLPTMGGQEQPKRTLYAETVYPARHFGWAPSFIAVDQTHVLRESGAQQVYDIQSDPYWNIPIQSEHSEGLNQTITAEKTGWDQAGEALDEATKAQLQLLGYATETPPSPSGERPDAASKMTVLNQLFLAQGKMQSDPQAAIKELTSLIQTEPDLLDAHYGLALAYMGQQDGERALEALESVLERAPQHSQALQSKAYVLRNMKRLDEAHATMDTLIALYPFESRWHHLKVDLYGRAKDFVGIRDACRKGLSQHPDDPFLHYMLGLALIQLDAPTQAIESLDQAERFGTKAKDIALWQGRAHELLGNVDEAIKAFHKDAKNRPEDVRPVGAAGRLLAKQKKCGEALPFLLKAIERGMRDAETLRAYRECGGQGF